MQLLLHLALLFPEHELTYVSLGIMRRKALFEVKRDVLNWRPVARVAKLKILRPPPKGNKSEEEKNDV